MNDNLVQRRDSGTWVCQYCDTRIDDRKVNCQALSHEHYICTREPGHDGPHQACGTTRNSHPIETWEQDS